MALLLYIDTATRNCSVALSEDETLLVSKTEWDTRSHAKVLQAMIMEILKEVGKTMDDLAGVVVVGGPGSYTGLRIGMSCAKGICLALSIPFIVLDTLESLALSSLEKIGNKQAYYISTLNSRKGEIYYCVMSGKGEVIEASKPAVVNDIDWSSYASLPIYVSGMLNDKIKNIIFTNTSTSVELEWGAPNYIKQGF